DVGSRRYWLFRSFAIYNFGFRDLLQISTVANPFLERKCRYEKIFCGRKLPNRRSWIGARLSIRWSRISDDGSRGRRLPNRLEAFTSGRPDDRSFRAYLLLHDVEFQRHGLSLHAAADTVSC